MLHTIGTPRASAGDDPVSHLLACHARIRHFTAMAGALAVTSASVAQLAEAAAAVRRYFTIGLPLHAADEDDSMRPLLLAAGVPIEVERALEAMTAEHVPIEALIADAAPLWGALAADPAVRARRATDLERVARALERLFVPHLRAEEEVIFPALRARLAPAAQRRLRDEIRARRAGELAAGRSGVPCPPRRP